MKDQWKMMNSDALNSQKDLNSFLKSLGADPNQEDLAEVAPLHEPPPVGGALWKPTDEQLLEVVIRTAQEEKDRREKAAEKRKQGGPAARSRKSMERIEKELGVKQEEEVKIKEDFVIDHLFRDLSPRLQKISDACMKDDADKGAQTAAAPGNKGARPAPALEEVTS